ncbi:AMP-binding protein [Streptomyces sp. NPDC046860]|uniref:AMP-binding protein n=1 Tax=Streptomyces sp. NPDC046860 TaxID=3154495 RepID=UPI0034065A2F
MRAVETVLRRHAEDGDRPLVEVTAGDGTTAVHSYRAVTRAARALGDRLAARVAGGETPSVGVLCGDSAEAVVAELALLALRMTACPVPPGASARTAAALLADVSAVLADSRGLALLASWADHPVLPAGCPVVPVDLARLTARAGGAYRLPDDDRDWICKLLPASGPPGTRVGIRAHAVAARLDALRAELPAGAFARCAVTLPLADLAHQVAATALTLADAGCLLLPPAGLPGAALPGWTAAVRPTALAVTPPGAVALIGAARTARREGRPVPAALFGTPGVPVLWCGTEVPHRLLRECEGLGLPVYAGYGLAETTGAVAWNTPAARRSGTVGRPLSHVRAEIAADGELLVGGAGLALPPAPDGAGGAADGPLRTGVRAVIDADGFLHLVRPERARRRPGQPLTPEIGRLLYSLVRSLRADRVVAYDGTADGSLDQLAAGARANGTGHVVGHVPDAHRAARAQARLTEAGLAPWAEVRHAGLHDLARASAPVDLALLDCRPDLTLPALTALEGRMRPGTIVLALGSAPAGPYLDRVRDGADYLSMPLPVGAGAEVSIRLTPAAAVPRPAPRPVPGPATPTPQSSGE